MQTSVSTPGPKAKFCLPIRKTFVTWVCSCRMLLTDFCSTPVLDIPDRPLVRNLTTCCLEHFLNSAVPPSVSAPRPQTHIP